MLRPGGPLPLWPGVIAHPLCPARIAHALLSLSLRCLWDSASGWYVCREIHLCTVVALPSCTCVRTELMHLWRVHCGVCGVHCVLHRVRVRACTPLWQAHCGRWGERLGMGAYACPRPCYVPPMGMYAWQA